MTTTDAEPISTIIAKKEFLSKRYQTVDNGILNRLWRLFARSCSTVKSMYLFIFFTILVNVYMSEFEYGNPFYRRDQVEILLCFRIDCRWHPILSTVPDRRTYTKYHIYLIHSFMIKRISSNVQSCVRMDMISCDTSIFRTQKRIEKIFQERIPFTVLIP